jgi:acyl-CoA reductase-like NAD-dependent aldehyde dehydrogenase
MSDYHLYIGGKAVSGARTMPVINPATEQPIATCPVADEAQLEEAIAAAKQVFAGWAATDIAERRKLILAAADAVEARADEMARLLTAEQGKPLPHAQAELFGTVYMMRALGGLDLGTRVLQDDGDGGKIVEHRTPLGVVAAITPWNFPLSIMTIKIVPALLAGNTVVAKPAPTTPLTSLVLGEIYNSVLPAGVFNVIVDQNDLGAKLTAHPDIAKVSFTGSTGTGKKVMQAASSSLKRLTLELGGNDAAIVLDDLEPRQAARNLFDGAMMNSGQVCLAIKRAYVPEANYEAICAELVKLAEAAIVEDGSKQGAQFGPIQNETQYRRVLELIEAAAKEGRVLTGGATPDRPGYFVRPTIVADVDDEARIVREEQFGPVLPVLRYTDIDDAIARANRSDYGLGGTVWSADPERALEVAKKIDSGIVWVNCHMNVDPNVPVGGSKQSGMGQELGLEGLHEFTQRHVVYVAKEAAPAA